MEEVTVLVMVTAVPATFSTDIKAIVVRGDRCFSELLSVGVEAEQPSFVPYLLH